ncbi:MAG: 50S ribosomal protein L24 [Clostridia bacterium]|nr:50S ribosomal protein L24 [Clostridia bacterium]
MANKLHLKTGDTVMIISGKDKGKTGKVLRALPKEGKILVEGVNMISKHQKPSAKMQEGGIIHKEAPIYSSKAMLVCSNCKKPTRRAYSILEDGTKVRICKKCGETFNN